MKSVQGSGASARGVFGGRGGILRCLPLQTPWVFMKRFFWHGRVDGDRCAV